MNLIDAYKFTREVSGSNTPEGSDVSSLFRISLLMYSSTPTHPKKNGTFYSCYSQPC